MSPVTGSVISITQYATVPLSSLTHEIVTVPTASVVTLPVWSTVASDVSDELHVTFLLSAVSGSTSALSQSTVPFLTDNSVSERLIDVTG